MSENDQKKKKTGAKLSSSAPNPASSMLAETITSVPSSPSRFADGFGSISAVAEVLTELLCRTTRAQTQIDDAARQEGLTEFGRFEDKYLNAVYRQITGQGLSTKTSAFSDKQQQMAESLLKIATQQGWAITDRDGMPQVPPRRFGYVDVCLVRDWFAQSRARNHAEFAQALSAALGEHEAKAQSNEPKKCEAAPRDAFMPMPPVAVTPEALDTREVVRAFKFIPKLKRALGDVNNHRWLESARVSLGRAPMPSTWCPVKLAEAISFRKGHEDDFSRAFLNDPVLRPWRDAWQEARRARNAFGR